jgi:hypothetical protein
VGWVLQGNCWDSALKFTKTASSRNPSPSMICLIQSYLALGIKNLAGQNKRENQMLKE